MCVKNCAAHAALTEGQIRELVRDAVGSTADAAELIVEKLARQTDPDRLAPVSVRMGGYRLELEPYKARSDTVRWSVWVDVGEGDIDQASRVFHWCPLSDRLDTGEMVALCKAIRQER